AGCLVHSDQGSVYTSDDWRSFLASHGLVCSMSRRGNCHEREAVSADVKLTHSAEVKVTHLGHDGGLLKAADVDSGAGSGDTCDG
ncbi:hypothetical protein AB5N79_24005, partial [Xanthomonas citri pv. citri]